MVYPGTRIVLLIGLILAMLTVTAAAHPPSNLVLFYDPAAGQLQVTFTHTVSDPSTHFIQRVTVEVEGGAGRLEKTYTSQPSPDTFTYTFPLQMPPGTIVRVRGECNIGGEVREELVIRGSPPETTSPPAITATITPAMTATATLPVTATTSIIPATTVTSLPTATILTPAMTIQTPVGTEAPTVSPPLTTQASGFTIIASTLALVAGAKAVLRRR